MATLRTNIVCQSSLPARMFRSLWWRILLRLVRRIYLGRRKHCQTREMASRCGGEEWLFSSPLPWYCQGCQVRRSRRLSSRRHPLLRRSFRLWGGMPLFPAPGEAAIGASLMECLSSTLAKAATRVAYLLGQIMQETSGKYGLYPMVTRRSSCLRILATCLMR